MKLEPNARREPAGLRFAIYTAAVLMVIGLLSARLVQMQVLEQDEYDALATGNALRPKVVEPARGLIRDRAGVLLVDNEPTYSVYVTPRYFDEAQLPTLARLLAMPDSALRVNYERAVRYSRYRTSELIPNVPYEAFARLQEESWRLRGITFEIGQKRRYHGPPRAAHVLGYLRSANERQLEQLRAQGYRLGDVVGQAGLEQMYEPILRGRPGQSFVLVNMHGMEVASYQGGASDIPPQSGFELHLTLDARTQALAESLMVNKRGGLVAIDVNTGGIIAMVSGPDYDPEGFTGRLSQEFVDHVFRNRLEPLFNRATQMQQPPGSTWKPFMGLWALEMGMVTPQTRLACGGGYSIGGRFFRCLGNHGMINLHDAMRVSCNTYFYRLMNERINGVRMDLTTWSQWARRFGFGTLAPIDFPNQDPGLIPDSSYFNRVFPAGWGPGFTVNLGIGQGNMGVTPLQLARATAAIANGGNLPDPHLILRQINPDTGEVIEPNHRSRPIPMNPEHFRMMQDAMASVVTGGTARRISLESRGVTQGGKTGTAQNPHGNNHSVYLGYAPAENPQIAVAAIIENIGFGGTVAAPMSSLVIEQYLLGNVERPELVRQLLALRSEGM